MGCAAFDELHMVLEGWFAVTGGPSCAFVVQMMQETAWRKSNKALKIAYLGKDGRPLDEKTFHSLYLGWVQKHNNTFDDECVPQDQGVYADPVLTFLDSVNPSVAVQHRLVTCTEPGVGHGPTFTHDWRTAQNELLNSHQQKLHSYKQPFLACTAAELCCLFLCAAHQVQPKGEMHSCLQM